jgi:PAS domain S-box-containing protein
MTTKVKAAAQEGRGPAAHRTPPPETHIESRVRALEIHQVELEAQNTELRRAQGDLERSRDHFLALYEHAPVGYLTLDPKGRILEANLTSASLLGCERHKLVDRALSSLMNEADADRFHLHRRELLEGRDHRGGLALQLQHGDGSALAVLLETSVVLTGDGPRFRSDRRPPAAG